MFMNSRMFGFKEVEEVKETRSANKTFYDKINKEAKKVKEKMTEEEWEKLLQDLDKPLSK